jgi:NNP family nitrate/nitrite transporter-like MFS transporter
MRSDPASWRRGVFVNVLGFTLAFGAWVSLGPATPEVLRATGVSPFAAEMIRALPILVGALLRVPIGVLADHRGARAAWTAVSLLSAAGFLVLSASSGVMSVIVGATLLGAAGATFSVAVQAISAVVPRAQRGFALGLLGAGEAGGAVALALLPALLPEYGWRAVMQGCAATLIAGAAIYVVMLRRDTRAEDVSTVRGLVAPLRYAEGWRLGLAYAATFGVFVSLALTGTDLLVDAYGCSRAHASLTMAVFAVSASLAHIPGGLLADRLRPRAVLDAALVTLCTALAALALHPSPAAASALMFTAGIASGVGSAAALRLVPDRFPSVAGAAGGVAGALGALGGFVLPIAGHALRDRAHAATAALVPMVAIGYLSLLVDHVGAWRRDRGRARGAVGRASFVRTSLAP